jgi:hypothetical protein
MFSTPDTLSIATACLTKKQTLKHVTRDGKKVWVVAEGKKEVFVSEFIDVVAEHLEREARKQPLVSTSPATHLFGAPCRVEFAEKRGEFYLIQNGLRVRLTWTGTGSRWVAFTECGVQLKYGPTRDFKLDWTEKDRAQPALRAWLAR